jgi:hypothetical protein
MPSAVDNEPPPPGELPSPAASSPSRAAAVALSSPSMQADLPMSPGRAAAAAIMRGISGMIGAALSPAIHRHPPTELVVGASPFVAVSSSRLLVPTPTKKVLVLLVAIRTSRSTLKRRRKKISR